MFKVEVHVPYLVEGGTIEIDGLGIFEQDQVVEVDDDAVEFFRQKHAVAGKSMRALKTLLKDSGISITPVDPQPDQEEEEVDPGTAEDSNVKEGE